MGGALMNHLTAETVRKEREEYLRQEAIEKETKRHKFEKDVERVVRGELEDFIETAHFAKLSNPGCIVRLLAPTNKKAQEIIDRLGKL